ncbi:hypothetical protein Vretimale_5924 [Volvox reticuliferus]|uniref:3-oxo-5-alpha-steroid 4-dehydrogenase C-terminal domain-containing protein n=1 Tax=Volvox reticuliferus TaxID=1737510 RepID=A0A8J4CAD5_9CHLO|nr:hypothetical protein Vretifemale_5975 [Volvox reticuliferus]GIM01074.1 hypothetical protein Vretimale_5924 [Volvox reticuliferus]
MIMYQVNANLRMSCMYGRSMEALITNELYVWPQYGGTYHVTSLIGSFTMHSCRRGGMFEYVSAGNYASEILEWTGFALAAGTLQAFAFALFTFCNLAPRGHHHHLWYQGKFKDEYPKRRKAVMPFIW